MTVVPATEDDRFGLPQGREWTVDDLDLLPDNGQRYELFDGVLVVSPAPVPGHQRAVFALARLLYASCPPELEVFIAPLDFRPNRARSFQPDVLVARRDQVGEKNLSFPPVLAVEVLSNNSRSMDLVWKRAVYAACAVPHYWTFDPEPGAPKATFTAMELVNGVYRDAAHAVGEETVRVERPYPVEVCPATVAAG
jgi:Uma2 family endonuclease